MAVALVVVVLSPSFGRAAPTGNYRPPLPADALTDGCWPLPGGAVLDFGYQVRSDQVLRTAAGRRRVLVLHYDRIEAPRVRREVRAAFARVGVPPGRVRVSAAALPGVADDALVRGTARLTMPPSWPDAVREECRDPYSTKRFPPPVPTL